MVQDTEPSEPRIDRRRVLQGVGAAGAAGVAGCLGDDDDDTDDDAAAPDDDDTDDDTDEAPDDPLDNLVEGGTLRVGVGSDVESFDPENSSDTTSTLAQSPITEGLVSNDLEGNLYPWLAETWEQVDVQDVSAADYEPYMTTFDVVEEGDDVFVDTEGQFEILRHPDDAAEEAGDEVRVLTFEDAAEAVDDGTYAIHMRADLRDEAEFADGSPVTADDVAASYDRLKGSVNEAQYYDSILYYEPDGDDSIHVYAQEVDAEAARELPPLAVHPEEQAEIPLDELDPREGNDLIGSGPYELVEVDDANRYSYEKRDDYWVEQAGVDTFEWFEGDADLYPDGPVIDRIEMEVIEEDATRSLALQNGEIDLTTGLASDTFTDFQESDEFEAVQRESGGYTYLQPPVNAEPWDDQRVRQAFNKLVPRQTIADNVFAGTVQPAWAMMPTLAAGTGASDYEALLEAGREFNEFDPEGAVELIEEAFDENDIDTPVEITVEVNSDNDDRVQLCEQVVESLNAVGDGEFFEADLETFEWTTYTGRVLSPDYGMPDSGLEHIGCIGLSGTFNPHSFVDALHNSANIGACCNLVGINEEWIDEALDDCRFGTDVTEDPDLRRERYQEMVLDLEEYGGSAITHFSTQDSFYLPRLRNWDQWVFHEGYLMYGVWSPQEEQVAWLDDAA